MFSDYPNGDTFLRFDRRIILKYNELSHFMYSVYENDDVHNFQQFLFDGGEKGIVKLREKQKAEVKSALIRAGEELFGNKGFTETTVEEITAAAGVARGTFYNYFQTKEDLALEILYETEGLTTEQVDDFFATTLGTENQIQTIITIAVEWTLRKPELFLVILIEKMKRGSTPGYANGTLFRRLITEAFERGQMAGVVTRERLAQELAHDIDGLYMVHMVRWYHYGKQGDLLSILLAAVNTYLSGAIVKQKTSY